MKNLDVLPRAGQVRKKEKFFPGGDDAETPRPGGGSPTSMKPGDDYPVPERDRDAAKEKGGALSPGVFRQPIKVGAGGLGGNECPLENIFLAKKHLKFGSKPQKGPRGRVVDQKAEPQFGH